MPPAKSPMATPEKILGVGTSLVVPAGGRVEGWHPHSHVVGVPGGHVSPSNVLKLEEHRYYLWFIY